MLNIVLFGAPGSGKGTQSELLIQKYGLYHVSTGDILRNEIKAQSELGKSAEKYMSKGQLVPDEVVIGILDELIRRNPDSKGFIFDGFPRTLSQGEALDTILAGHGEAISAVVSLEVEDEELIERLLKRGQVSGRSDDNRETIEARLKVYYNQTLPLKDYYDKQNKLKKIQGTGSIEEIFESIRKEIDPLVN
ncbi:MULTISPECIES: adenylate kinase [Dysgonomonadaceae]|jgi:adenylate kinase|uniref:adenylate kinase n=1 Tax=Dysgonomonadaceae TaxID=2005520 RepID=UPI000E8611DE|nr:adenylate kinase [Proteiniphilum sp. UBA5259]HBG39825.1 adenylate kinase [Porphyromonadaceae bacterium]HBL33851.1 adenylate kinase [Porphyromonadaceae bacterium]HBX44661.1 adenylate kinase [Porphyromonadaceae bacterium]HCM19314.1 adenylate kinase [Porphyromonadaceae bacterium]